MDTERQTFGQLPKIRNLARQKVRSGHLKDQRSGTGGRGRLLLRALQPVRADDGHVERQSGHQRAEASGPVTWLLSGHPGEKNPAAEDD